MDFSNINWLAMIVAAVSSFAIGAIWYGPVFGKKWQQAVGLSDEEMKNANMGKLFGTAFILAVVISFGMAMFFGGDPATRPDAGQGAMYGAMTGIFFVFPSTWMNYLFARKSTALIFIDSFYHIVTYTVIGVILGAWH